MLVDEKELEYFKSAKKYFNSSPSEYSKSLKELNKISLLIQNITIIHMKTLCLLMLSKYEDIIEFYYLNRNHLEILLRQKNSDSSNDNNDDNENEKEEIKKIISIAFFNLGMKKKAKILCPDIKDEYIIEKSEFEIIQNKEDVIDNRNIKINSNRINKNNLLRNIKNNLDKNKESKNRDEDNKVSNNLNNSKELISVTNDFVDNLFKSAIAINKMRNPKQEIKEEFVKEEEEPKNNKEINDVNSSGFVKQNESLFSNSSNVSNINKKLQLEINLNNINKIKKEDEQLMTLEEKIKANLEENNIENNDKSNDDKNNDDKNNDNKSHDDKSIDHKGNENIDDKSNGDKSNDKKSDKKDNNDDKKNCDKNNDDKKSDSKNSVNKTINKDENKENVKKENNDKNNEKKINNDNNNTNNENNINIKSNRSEKYNNQKEIKGLLNKQKIPYMRKLTKEEVVRKRLEGVKTKEKAKEKKEENIKNTIEEKNEIIEEKDNIEKEIKKELEEKKEIIIENKENNVLKENKETKDNIESKEEKENEENIINELKDNKNKIETQNNKEEKNENNNKSNNNNYIKKSFTHDKKMTFINKELKRIYPKPDDNEKNNIRKDNINDKNKRISLGNIKSCKTNSFKNPFEFTLNPEEGGSFEKISSNSSINENNEKEKNKNNNINENIQINDKKDEINKDSKNEQVVSIDQNRALLRVEIDGEQIDLIQNENPSRKNSKYANYINIDYNEFSNKKRKKMIDKFRNSAEKGLDIINKNEFPKSTKINSYVLRGIKNSNPFNINEAQSFSSMADKTPSNIKKTCIYKSIYFLDKFDSK